MVSATLRATKPEEEAGCLEAGPQQRCPSRASSLGVVLGGLNGLHWLQGGLRSDLGCGVICPRGYLAVCCPSR